jgi:hypothetical protein
MDLEAIFQQHLDDGARDGIVDPNDLADFIAGQDDDEQLRAELARAEVPS